MGMVSEQNILRETQKTNSLLEQLIAEQRRTNQLLEWLGTVARQPAA